MLKGKKKEKKEAARARRADGVVAKRKTAFQSPPEAVEPLKDEEEVETEGVPMSLPDKDDLSEDSGYHS
jgi:hypothetical protein